MNILIILCILRVTHSIPTKHFSDLISSASKEKQSLEKPLGYIEDMYLNFTELTSKYGYVSEQHTVMTEDGYLLTVFRILSKCQLTQGFPVILGHGIADSSDAWILTGPKLSLGYILSDNCYDVWAVNYRGNIYSRKHVRLDPDKDREYWEFSFDENGKYDLPAVIDYVLSMTSQLKMYYIGHSQGSTDFFVMGSIRPDYNEKVRLSIHLAPVAWMKNAKTIIPKIITRQSKEIRNALEFAGLSEVLAKHQFVHKFAELVCQLANGLCGAVLALSTGYELGSVTSSNLAVATGHVFVGVSAKNLAHFAQLLDSGEFRRYDEGKAGNIRRYGSAKPPKYDVSRITSPVLLICGKKDYLSTIEDLEILTSKLPNLVENYIVPEPTWSHINHIWSNNATELVFKRILYYFQMFNT